MRTTVAHSMSVASGMPLAAIGAREEVAPHCVTDLSATLRLPPRCHSCKLVRTFSRERLGACEHRLRIAGHLPQCEECPAMLSFSWFPAVREKRYAQDCALGKGSFRKNVRQVLVN